MPWVRLDDKFWRNDKIAALSDAAYRAFMDSVSFCGDTSEPTGFVPANMAGAFIRIRLDAPTVLGELVPRLWEPVNGGYLIHDYEDYLPKNSTARVRAWRAKKRAEKRAGNADVTPNATGNETPVQRPMKHQGNSASHARAVPEPEPVPVPEPEPVIANAPLIRYTPPAPVMLNDDPSTKLALWWHEFIGRQISEHDRQAAAAFIFDYPRLGLNGIERRIQEHAAWRAENNLKPLGKLEFYRDALRDQETHLADEGVPRPRDTAGAFAGLLKDLQ